MLPSRKEILVFDYYPTSRYAIYFRMNIRNILLLIHVFKLGYLSFSEVLLNWRVFITLWCIVKNTSHIASMIIITVSWQPLTSTTMLNFNLGQIRVEVQGIQFESYFFFHSNNILKDKNVPLIIILMHIRHLTGIIIICYVLLWNIFLLLYKYGVEKFQL